MSSAPVPESQAQQRRARDAHDNPAAYGPGEWVELKLSRPRAGGNAKGLRHGPRTLSYHGQVDMTAVESLLSVLGPDAEKRSIKLTARAFHVKALARALAEFPKFNAVLSADGSRLWRKHTVDIGIAFDTAYGSMTPVIRGCEHKTVWQIAGEIGDFMVSARTRSIRPGDLGGASMSITSLAEIGDRDGAPELDKPEVAVLGLTRASMEPVWNGEAFDPALICPLDLAYDRRVIERADAEDFVSRYATLIGEPHRLMP